MAGQASPSPWGAPLADDHLTPDDDVIDGAERPHPEDGAFVERGDVGDGAVPERDDDAQRDHDAERDELAEIGDDISEVTTDDESLPSEVDQDENGLADEHDSVGDGPRQIEEFEGEWVNIAQASQVLGISETTVRRKVKTGELKGEMAFDPSIGSKRWLVDLSGVEIEQPETATLVPMAAIDRLEKAWGDTRDAVARAETAERIANFERERRIEAEGERDRLRSLLTAENDLAQRIAELEKNRRIQAEKERDRLRALLEVEPKNTWWMKMKDRFRL